MKPLLKLLYKLLKVLSWAWIGFFSLLLFSIRFTDGNYNLDQRLLLLLIICAVPSLFLLWRFHADKAMQLQKQQLQFARRQQELSLSKQFKAFIYQENSELASPAATRPNRQQIKNKKYL